eukprot:6288166-Prymnesium_polylepis.1
MPKVSSELRAVRPPAPTEGGASAWHGRRDPAFHRTILSAPARTAVVPPAAKPVTSVTARSRTTM